MMERITKAEAREKMICSLPACGDDFSRSDFWPIFATKTGRKRVLETGVCPNYGKTLHTSHNLSPLFLLFLPFFLPLFSFLSHSG